MASWSPIAWKAVEADLFSKSFVPNHPTIGLELKGHHFPTSDIGVPLIGFESDLIDILSIDTIND